MFTTKEPHVHNPQKPVSNHPPKPDSPISLTLLQIPKGDVPGPAAGKIQLSFDISVIRHFYLGRFTSEGNKID